MRPSSVLRSTSFRLAAWYAGLFGVSVMVLFAVIYWIATGALRQQLQSSIEREMASLIDESRKAGPDYLVTVIRQRLAESRAPRSYYLLLSPAGRPLAGNLPAMIPTEGWMELAQPHNREAAGSTEETDPAEDGRVIVLGRRLPDGSFLAVGEDGHRLEEAQEAIFGTFGWALAVTVALALGGGALLSTGFLRRIEVINRTSRAIMAGNLSERVPTLATGDELDRLATNLNAMLDRIQTLMQSLKQVSDDIAHDLKTPLSRLRQRLESVRMKAGASQEYEAAVEQAIADVDAILETFAALLRIAQIEAGTRRAGFSDVDLSDMVRSVAETYAAVAEDRGQRLVANVDRFVTLHGDRELLTQMAANLVENAIRHCPPGVQISLGLVRNDATATLTVADTGPGIRFEERERVLRRFYRLESSRTTPGSGLGLALVKAVADLHGAALELSDNGPGLRVSVRFSARENA